MQYLTLSLSILLLLLNVTVVYAGGAVAKRRQNQQAVMQQRRMQQQQAMMQQHKAMQQKKAQQAGQQVQQQPPAEPVEVKDVATLDQVVASLERSSHDWALMIDFEAKEAVVEHYIRKFKEAGITVRKPPAFYVSMIDGMAQSNPSMLAQPFVSILRVVTVIEYDFDNGENKDAMALKVLGSEEAVQRNRERLGM